MVPGLYDTAVIGGGVSGCSVILALGGTVDPGYRAAVFEPGRLGPGVAYGDQPAALLMNGGANTMSLLPDDRYHLLRWLGSNDGNALIARRRFGDYVADTVQRVIASHPGFSHVQSEIVDVLPHHEGYILVDERGERSVARNVVLAFGNFAPNASFLPEAIRNHDYYQGDPWHLNLGDLEGDVAIVGSRLTALDVLAQLDERGFRGRTYLISRHGVAPLVEDPAIGGLNLRDLQLEFETPHALLRSMRRAAKKHVAAGGDWRAIVESIRKITPEIWAAWSARDKRRFLRHLQSLWAAHRYRAPRETFAAFERRIESGRAELVKGRIAGAERTGGKNIVMTVKCADRIREIEVQAVVNATGPNSDYSKIDRPLVRNLLRRGLMRTDELRLGIDASKAFRVYSREGAEQPRLFALGPPLRGLFYEATAVPEITRHARAIASELSRLSLVLGAVS